MRKRMLSWGLILSLLLTMLPVSAMAAESGEPEAEPVEKIYTLSPDTEIHSANTLTSTGTADHSKHTGWTPLYSYNSTINDGNYYLSNTVTTNSNITVSGTWSGVTQSASGARVYVAALPQQAPNVEGQKGHLVEVTASQARTYPAGVLNNDPNGSCFPLPKGTVDYIVSDKLTYYDDTYGSGEYYILGSGVRVSASSVSSLGEAEWQMSSLSGASSWADGQYVYVSFARSGRKTAYTVSFDGVGYSSSGGVNSFSGATSMVVTLKDTRADTAAPSLASNNLLSGVSLSQQGNDTVIRFDLRKAGSFLGYRAYYDGDSLVFRFNQIPNGLSGAKIYLDPGHGGYDGGTSISGMYTEKTLNADIANRVADILRSRGATVQVTDTSSYVSLDSRVNQSQSFSPHLFVSIHHNAGVSSAKGTEVYYFNPYSRQLAANRRDR